jgi:PAS domain S-box-containing protein
LSYGGFTACYRGVGRHRIIQLAAVGSEEARVQNDQSTAGHPTVEAEQERYRTLFELAPAAYLLTDRAGVIEEANRRAVSLLGLARPFLVGMPLAVFVAAEDREGLRDRLSRVDDLDGEAWQLRLQPWRRDPVPVAVSLGAARDQAGAVTGLRWQLLELPPAGPAGASPGRPADADAGDRDWLVEPTGPTHPAVGRAIGLLNSQLSKHWTLRELADQLHLSPGYLLRLFKSSTGMPPMTYLARRRVETAAALLSHTDKPVTEIGRTVGWPDQNYFARRFKAHFGVSPSAYRRTRSARAASS